MDRCLSMVALFSLLVLFPHLTVAHHPIPTHDELEKLLRQWESEKNKAEAELEKTQDALDKEKIRKKIRAAMNCLHVIQWVVDHIDDINKRRIVEPYNNSVEIFSRIHELPGARDRLRENGFTENGLDNLLEELNKARDESETGEPAHFFYRKKAEEHLSVQHIEISTREGQDKLEGVIKDMIDFYTGEVDYKKASKGVKTTATCTIR